MSKRDNNTDGTPIEFYIPGPGKGSKIPVPINQPNWKYKHNRSKPSVIEWILVSFSVLLFLVIGFVGLYSTHLTSYIGIFFIILLFLSLGQLYNLITRHRNNYSEETFMHEKPEKRKKKQPKHRKDYK